MQRYDSHKDSGIQWLGQIPGHWEIKKLKVFCKENKQKNKGNVETTVLSLSYGHIKIKEDLNFGLIPENYESYQIVFPGDVVLRLTDLQNDHRSLRTGLVKDKGIITSAYVGLKISQANSAYIQLLLHTYDIFKLFYSMGGGLRQSMSYLDVSNLLIPIPPLAEQKAIVTYLDGETEKIDSFISSKEKEIRLLEELKQAEIANAVTKGLHPDVPLKDSGISWLGQIPRHWEMIRNKSFMRPTDEKVGDRRDEFVLLSLTKQGVIIRDLSERKGKFPTDYNTYLVVRPSNLVFCLFDIDETPRTVGLVENIGMLTGAYSNFEFYNDVVLPKFAYYYYLKVDDVKGLRPYYTGLRKVVKSNTFAQLRIPIPPLPEQKEIVEYLDRKCANIDKMISNIEQEITQLKEYKQRLIADAVTGQIKVC